MTNTISKPTWLYKPINVDNLENIQKEFRYIHTAYMSNLFKEVESNPDHLWSIDKELIETHAPTFIELLTKLDLYHRWGFTAFSPTSSSHTQAMAHIDNIDWTARSYGLNLPIQNCQDSYTVFYKTEVEGTCGLMPWYENSPCFLDNELIEELGRLPAAMPAFVNVTYPHRSLSEHKEFRLVITTRFFSEIHDYDFDRLQFPVNM
jgi:hypothetical protein